MFNPLNLFRRRNRRHRPMTLAGRFFLIGSIICLHGLVDQSILPLLAYVLSVLAIAVATSFLYRPGISTRGILPSLVCAGDDFEYRIVLVNRRLLHAYDLHVELIDLPDGWELTQREQLVKSLGPGETRELVYRPAAVARGQFRLPRVRLYSTFPFNLFCQTRISPSPGKCLVAPSLGDGVFGLDAQQQGVEMTDLFGRRRASSSLEYIGSREYQPGTPVRRWDFSSWARVGTPTVCEFVEGMHRRAIVIADLQRLSKDQLDGNDPAEAFEALLSRTATIVDVLDRSGYEIQMILCGDTTKSTIGSPEHDQRKLLLETLAVCQPSRNLLPDAPRQVADIAMPQSDVFVLWSQPSPLRDQIIDAVSDEYGNLRIDVISPDLSWETSR